MLLELLQLPGELEVLVDVPARGVEDLVGELEAGGERNGEGVELALARLWELDAGVLDLVDDGEEVVDGVYQALRGGLAEAVLPADLDQGFQELRRDLAGKEIRHPHLFRRGEGF